MLKRSLIIALFMCGLFAQAAFAASPADNLKPVTNAMLEHPSPNDWLMYSRTYDANHFSPLKQINKRNVHRLQLAWSTSLGHEGEIQSQPLEYDGVMYILGPNGKIFALDATNGDVIWTYERDIDPKLLRRDRARGKSIAIWENEIISTTPDGYLVALNAQTGKVIWQTNMDSGQQSSGPIVANGIIVSGRACKMGDRESCFIAGNDAKTGKLLWKFYDIPAKGEPGSDSWGEAPTYDKNTSSTWALPGSYDPKRNLVLWGVANPVPNTRAARHGGNAAGTAFSSPADLYSNSTVALDLNTGKLKWYYQHLPGDDWDTDMNEDRILLRTRINPDPKYVKWINKDEVGTTHDISVMIGEGGGIFVNDRGDGKFLWATPFPFDTPYFVISKIDTKTGQTFINKQGVLMNPGQRSLTCFWNTKSYWTMSYSPRTKSLYTTYIDNCLDMTRAKGDQRERRTRGKRPGYKEEISNGLAKIDMETGKIMFFNQSNRPSTGDMLATAGGVVFNGDLYRYFRAFDDETGKLLWQTRLPAPVTTGTISYAVNGKQYVAVFGAFNFASMADAGMWKVPDYVRDSFGVYVFALPGRR